MIFINKTNIYIVNARHNINSFIILIVHYVHHLINSHVHHLYNNVVLAMTMPK